MEPTSLCACALYLGLWSWHAEPAENETHDLIGFQYESLMIGHMKNSYGKDSWVVGIELFKTSLTDNLTLKGAAGFRSGYEDEEKAASNDVVPMIGMGFEYQIVDHLVVDFTFALSVATIGFKFNF